MSSPASVAVVVPVRNRAEKTLRFMAAFRQQSYLHHRLFVVDSASSDGTPDLVRAMYPDVVVLQATRDDFWTGATNLGIRTAVAAGFDYVLTINDDCVVLQDFLEKLVAVAERFQQPILGCRIDFLADPGRVWAIGARHNWGTAVLFGLNYYYQRSDDLPPLVCDAWILPVESMPGNGVLIASKIFGKVGYYDEVNAPHYHADTEFMLRARTLGFVPMVTTQAIIYNDAALEHPGASAAPHPLRDALRPRRLLSASRNFWWMLSNKKSHYYLKPHLFIIMRYAPPGTRVASFWLYLASVARQAFGLTGCARRLARGVLYRIESRLPRLGRKLRQWYRSLRRR